MNSPIQSPSGPYLVTGAAGFIGSSFVRTCNSRGIPVVSVDRASYFGQRPEHQGIDFGKIVDMDQLETALAQGTPEKILGSIPRAIIHLGACADTTEMDLNFLERVNVKYSQFLWEYATARKIPLVYASSAATYGEGEGGYDDDEPRIPSLRPLNPYGQSKQDFDLWALGQEKAGHAPRAWSGFKFFNVYGFGERHKGKMASVVLHAFDQIRKEGKIRLFKSHRAGIADGHQKRDFIHVDDVTSALHFAAEKPIGRGVFNLGTGQARTFLDLARAVFAALGKPGNIEFIDTPVSIRDRYQYFTEAKMERLRAAGFTQPFRSLEEGVKLYVAQLEKEAASRS